jgi:hypothetical protein
VFFDSLIALRKCSSLWGDGYNHRALYAIAKGLGEGSVLIPEDVHRQIGELESDFAQMIASTIKDSSASSSRNSCIEIQPPDLQCQDETIFSECVNTSSSNAKLSRSKIKQSALDHVRQFVVRSFSKWSESLLEFDSIAVFLLKFYFSLTRPFLVMCLFSLSYLR